MDSTTSSDAILQFVIAITGVFLVLCFLLLLTALGFRVRSWREQRKRERVIRVWRPILIQVITDSSFNSNRLPSIARSDRKRFIELWSVMHAYVRGSGDDAMNLLAARIKLHQWITPLLNSPSLRTRIAATTALGYSGKASEKQLKRIEKSITDKNRLLSVTALRSLLNLDHERGFRSLRALLATKDWSDSRVISALREAPLAAVLNELQHSIETAPRRGALRCFRLIEQLRGYTARDECLTLLERFPDDPAVRSQFLRLVNLPSLLPLVLESLAHQDAEIRALAVEAVGRIGSRQEMPALAERLGDEDLWVCYDAAATLILLPQISDTDILRLIETEPDSAGKDILYELHQQQRRLI